MYPESELTRLARRRAVLGERIAGRRAMAARAASRIARPLVLCDRIYGRWRQIAPAAQIAALPLAFALKRTLFPRWRMWRSLLRWSPLVLGVARRVVQVWA